MSWRSTDTPPPPSLALIEMSSIARGIEVCDAMLKAAEVTLVMARTICSGKYMVVIAGELAEVQASMDAGLELSRECTIDSMTIADVHPDVFPAIASTSAMPGKPAALGIIESFSVAALVEAIDKVAKAADAMEPGVEIVTQRGLLVNQAVIPDPRPELFRTLI